MPTMATLDPQGLRDFWAVYAARTGDILAKAARGGADHPGFGPVLRALTLEQVAAQNDRWRRMLEQAAAGDWAVFDADLRALEVACLKLGVTLGGWYDVVGMIQGLLRPLLVEAHVKT